MEFAKAAGNYTNLTRTENNAVALTTTGNALVDLFATIGALRLKSDGEIENAFNSAFAENKLLATKMMFYARNIRGGLGERRTFRAMLRTLAEENPEIVIMNLDNIPLFGRYDDLYTLVGTKAENPMWTYLAMTIRLDMEKMKNGEPVTLCAKWLKSINTSSPESVKLGKETARQFHMSHKEYRKMLSKLRNYIKLTETAMSSKDWNSIDYSHVPSRAMKNYYGAFKKHDETRFSKFLEKVSTGEEKINASTLYPYDILMKADLDYGWEHSHFSIKKDATLEALWSALPNYVEGENNVLVMADTSGSMDGMPMATSVGLAIYFAERNKGAYKDLFLTFSREPKFVRLTGKTLAGKISNITSIVANTDLEKAFDLILNVALQNNVSEEEMPKSLIIITDMHFDEATSGGRSKTFFTSMKEKFAENGYVMPTVIFWNVSQRANAFQARENDANVILVSGHSTSTFKTVLGSISKSPYDFMIEALSDPMYDVVVV